MQMAVPLTERNSAMNSLNETKNRLNKSTESKAKWDNNKLASNKLYKDDNESKVSINVY